MNYTYQALTVNERLFLSGLMDEFDRAVEEKDTKAIIKILNKVEITDVSAIQAIIEKLGL